MNFLQRAWRNIRHGFMKTVLYGLGFFMIGNLLIIGLGIKQAGNNALSLTKAKIQPIAAYELDREKFYDDAPSFITDYDYKAGIDEQEAIKTMSTDNRVIAINAEITMHGYYGGTWPYDITEIESDNPYYTQNEFFLLVGGYYDNPIEIVTKGYTLTEGRFYTEQDIQEKKRVAVINNRLAEINNIKLNDTITIAMDTPNSTYAQRVGIPQEYQFLQLQVIGIYENHQDSFPDNAYPSVISLYPNKILLPGTVLAEVTTNRQNIAIEAERDFYLSTEGYDLRQNITTEEDHFPTTAVFLLDHPDHIESFKKDYEKYTNSYIVLNINDQQFEALSKPLETISYFAQLILVIVVTIAMFMITIITSLALKIRETEIGLQLAVGVRKMRIISQFFAELAIILTTSFLLSFLSGTLLVNKIGYRVLEYQNTDINTEEFISSDSIGEKYFTELSMDDMISAYQITITPLNYLTVYVIGLFVVLGSLIIPALMVMRSNPKKIMSRIG